jgi:hypothetical protein
MDWWRRPLGALVSGRRVIVVGGPAAAWTSLVIALRDLGATDALVVATEGLGAGAQPEATIELVEVPGDDTDAMVHLHAGLDILAALPPATVDAVEAFDPDRTAVVFGTFLHEAPELAGRPLVAHRRPEWVMLEDKTIVDALLDRAGVARAASTVVPVGEAAASWRPLDHGHGTVWAADALHGYHGGAARTRWVTDDGEAAAATADLSPWCDTVRVMPFLEGIATSVHGIVLPDGVVALRPVELVTLRRGHELRYSGCATFWDPPPAVREEMRDAARRVGVLLQDEVGYRGAFTLDGVATAEGFRPTELNPRFGAGLGIISDGLDDLPLHQVLDLVVSGTELELSAIELEELLLDAADAHRNGGTWQLHAQTPVEVSGRAARYDAGIWRWAEPDEPSDGAVVAKGGYARISFDAASTPVGPSVGERSVAFWRFSDAELRTGNCPLGAPPVVTL